MNKKICDRCGKTLRNYNYWAVKIGKGSFYIFCNKEYVFDLCDDCQKDFMKFLGEGGKFIKKE